MRVRVTPLSLVFLLLALTWSASPAMAQLGFVSGEVVDENDEPLQGVDIRIEGIDTPRRYSLKTDRRGRYIHAGINLQGTYRVIAEAEGYRTDYVEGIRPGFSRDDERGIINFKLSKGTAQALDFEMTDEQRAELERQRAEAVRQAERMEKVQSDFDRAVTLYNSGQFEQAAATFERVIEVEKEQPVVWANLANAYARLQQHDKAVTAYNRAIELDPRNSGYLQNLGSIYSSMGDAESAREMYESAASLAGQLNPKEAAISYYNMGVTYINAGQNEQAAEALRKAVELDPGHAESHYQLGITMIGLNDMDGAIAELRKYIEIAPIGENAEVAKALIEQLGG
jgi:tetratricopeptide (TPR) repeat protein